MSIELSRDSVWGKVRLFVPIIIWVVEPALVRAGDRPFASLWQFGYRRKVMTNQQTLRDYTFLNPNYNLEHQHHTQSAFLTDKNAIHPSQSVVNSEGVSSSSPQFSSFFSQLSYEKYDYPGRYKLDK